MSLPPEIAKKVQMLDISTRKLVNNLFAGEYHTVFKGQGMAFADFREYVVGDDIRSISWTLTARAGKPFIKRYEEERELTLMLVMDVSGSGEFGSGTYLKGEVAAFIAALLGFSAARNNDRVGLMLFSDEVEKFVPPKKGRPHVQRILSDVLHYEPKSHKTDLSVACQDLMGVLKKKATVFLISDFLAEGFERELRILGGKHDVVAIVVEDSLEKDLPAMGLVDLEDAETAAVITVDTSDPIFRREFNAHVEKRRKLRSDLLKKSGVDVVEITSGENFLDPLVSYFKGRHRR